MRPHLTPPPPPQLVLFGLLGVAHHVQYRSRYRFLWPSAAMVLVGLGSIGFHASLRWGGQALDELSMVACVLAYLNAVLERHEHRTYPWLPNALLAYWCAFAVVYALLPQLFSLFVITFAVLSVVVFAASTLYAGAKEPRLKSLFWVGMVCYITAFLACWLPDTLLCARLPGGLYLHAWWHLLSAVAPWCLSVFVTARWYEERLEEAVAAAAAAPPRGDVGGPEEEKGVPAVPVLVWGPGYWGTGWLVPWLVIKEKV